MYSAHSEKRRGGVLVSRIASPYPGANHVAPPATKDEREYCIPFLQNHYLQITSVDASLEVRYSVTHKDVSMLPS